ncbi:MAG: hypothetical protein ACKVPX_09935 [Myxococcaceae bacterium]
MSILPASISRLVITVEDGGSDKPEFSEAELLKIVLAALAPSGKVFVPIRAGKDGRFPAWAAAALGAAGTPASGAQTTSPSSASLPSSTALTHGRVVELRERIGFLPEPHAQRFRDMLAVAETSASPDAAIIEVQVALRGIKHELAPWLALGRRVSNIASELRKLGVSTSVMEEALANIRQTADAGGGRDVASRYEDACKLLREAERNATAKDIVAEFRASLASEVPSAQSLRRARRALDQQRLTSSLSRPTNGFVRIDDPAKRAETVTRLRRRLSTLEARGVGEQGLEAQLARLSDPALPAKAFRRVAHDLDKALAQSGQKPRP